LKRFDLRELFQHFLGRHRGRQVQLCPVHSELLRIQLERRHVAFAEHPLGVLERVLGTGQVRLGDRDVRIHLLLVLAERAFEILLNGNLGDLVVLLGLNVRGPGLFEDDALLIDLVLQLGRIEPDQLGPFGHLLAVFDDPEDRAAAGHLALDVDVLGAFQVSVLSDRDQQLAAGDGMREERTGRPLLQRARQRGVSQRAQTADHRHDNDRQAPFPAAASAAGRIKRFVHGQIAENFRDECTMLFGCLHREGTSPSCAKKCETPDRVR
jgi:hypothetical protein